MARQRRQRADTFADAEQAAFVEGLPRHFTFSDLARACLERFGPDRAWSRNKIARYWLQTHPQGRGGRYRCESDPEIKDFILDRLGRFTLDQIVADGRTKFGSRAPSRSAIHRYATMRRTLDVVGNAPGASQGR